ncbi:MAG: substrate-binding domain-containing protein [Treponema sp.]|jgi:D-xylose transport system substrate-binding protein|nr:substrate-binding domain-containing protein [Treponema sp.]
MKRALPLFLCVLMLSACSAGREAAGDLPVSSRQRSEKTQSPADKQITIGFSIATATFIIERWNKDLKVFSGAAQELGANVIAQLSAGGTREQIAQINYLMNQNIDILVVIANDTEVLAGAVKQVRDAGIPVLAYDRMITGTPLDGYISFDSREVGRHFGQALKTAVPRGRYLAVNGSIHDVNSFEISEGFHEIIDPAIKSGDITLREIWLEDWSFDEALEKIGAIFEETTGFDAIACGNDGIAGAAVQLLSERRLAGKVAVVGQDAELIGCQHIMEGVQLMTVYKPIGKLAVRAAQLAIAMAKNQSVPCDTLKDNGSGAMISAYLEPTVPVFRDNMDVVIRDGFHSYEDIYRTVMDIE